VRRRVRRASPEWMRMRKDALVWTWEFPENV
jgi:hypothetical protein